MKRKQHFTSGLLAAFLFVAAMMLPASVWAQSVTTEQPAAGDGTSANPYQIANAAQLAWFRDWVNGTYTPAAGETATKHASACAKLTADINMSTVCSGAIGSWDPISRYDLNVNWNGTFDGDGHTLSNLYVNMTTQGAGMFGYTMYCTIKNITFSRVNITGTTYYTGIIGYLKGSVTNVTVKDGVITGDYAVGGICGMQSSGTVSHCTNHAQVTGRENVGGISGEPGGTIEYCTNYGAVKGTGADNGSIGGIGGGSQDGGSISHCANYGNVEGNREVGGILGWCGKTAFSLANVMSTGNVTETNSNNTAGMVVGRVQSPLTLSDYAVFNSDATLTLNGTPQTARGIGYIDSGNGGSVSGKTAGYTTAQLQSGMVTYLLQSAVPEDTWGQQLGTDDYPLLGSVHTVYAEGSISILCTGAISGGSFSNTRPAVEATVTFTHGTITHHAAVEKTCTSDGNVEYWHCDLCHMYYTDAKLTTVIADPVLHATGHNYNYTTGSCTVCGEVIPIITEGTHTIQIAAVSGGLIQINGYNLYRFVAPGNGDLTVTTTGSADTYGSLWSSNGKTQLTTNDDAGGDEDYNFGFTYTVTKGTVYYIGVRLRSGAALDGNYTITLSGTWPPYVEALTLADGEAYNSTAQNALNCTYARNFAHTQWQPLYVPVAMKSADWTAQGLEVACINNCHEYEQADGSTKVVLEVKKVTTGMLRPNTPYLIRAIEAGNKTITLSYVELAEPANNTIDCASVTRTYTFTGIYAEKSDFDAANDYTMTAGDLYHPAGTLKPQRWYLSVASRDAIIDNEPGSASPRVISVSVIGEGEATGIDEIGIISHTTASGHSGLYDMQGRRLNHEPAHGIYIRNGRKVVR